MEKNLFAIWLVPENIDFQYLKKIIDHLSDELKSPKFLPHITIYGIVDIEQKRIQEVVDSLHISPFTVKSLGVRHSEDFWKTLYIEIQENEKLNEINLSLKKEFDEFSKYEFLPHISLAYKKMETKQKIDIIKKLDIKKEFLIDQIAILKYTENIAKWEIVKSWKLQ